MKKNRSKRMIRVRSLERKRKSHLWSGSKTNIGSRSSVGFNAMNGECVVGKENR